MPDFSLSSALSYSSCRLIAHFVTSTVDVASLNKAYVVVICQNADETCKRVSGDNAVGKQHVLCSVVRFMTSLCGGWWDGAPFWAAQSIAVYGGNGNVGTDRMSSLHALEVVHKFEIMLKLTTF